ncbi:MAG: POTRA domain-containing protein [Desulfobacterales bacterium]|jgi:outer membrane protein insertion porin family
MSTTGRCQEPAVDRIDVRIVGTPEDPVEWETLAGAIIDIPTGAPLDPARLNAAITTLKNTQLFESIDVPDPDWNARPVVLVFRLTPFPRIKNIRIHGAFPLFEREVLTAMEMTVGGPLVESRLSRAKAALETLYQNNGYIDPKAFVASARDETDGRAIVDVSIQKGDYYRIHRLTVDGNLSFSDGRLLTQLPTWRASLFPGSFNRFNQSRLRKDLDRLTDFYRRKGFPEVIVSQNIAKTEGNRQIDIHFHVVEGPRYRVSFEGNSAFWDVTLKKDLTFFSNGNKDDLGLRKSIRNIKKRYIGAGYKAVQVEMESQTDTENGLPVRHIRLVIDEGPQFVVGAVTIEGNRNLGDNTLHDALMSRPPGIISDGAFVEEVLAEDRTALEAAYRKEGFSRIHVTEEVTPAEADSPGTRPVDITLSIDEGPRTRVEAVRIDGLSETMATEASDLLAVKAGGPFSEDAMSDDEKILSRFVSERGYPQVTVVGRAEIGPDPTLATVVYAIDKGPFVRMGRLFTVGNFRTAPKIFENEMTLREGEPFSRAKMLASRRNIRNINAIDQTRFSTPGLEDASETVHLIAQVEEKKPYYLEMGLGYDTDREWFANGKIGDRNLFGLNKEGWVGGEVSKIGYLADLGITEPRFLGTRIAASAGLSLEKREDLNQDFGFRSRTGSLVLSRSFGPRWSPSLGFRLERREQYLTDNSPDDLDKDDLFDQRTILVTTPAVTYNTTDSFTRPREGALVLASIDVSTALQNSLDDFLKYRLDARWYATPLERFTVALRGRAGHIDPLKQQTTIPDDQLFYLGGLGNVRGFNKNELRIDERGKSVGGRTEFMGSVEARIEVWDNVEWALFYDVGSIKNATTREGNNGFRSSVGFGLRYLTPVGAVGLLYGHKLDPDSGEDSGEWHFSFGYSF